MKTQEIPTEEQKIEPCEHMTDQISAMSDGSLRGPAYWFTRFHLLHCRKCGTALLGFESLRSKLHLLRDAPVHDSALDPQTRSALQRAMDELDEKHA